MFLLLVRGITVIPDSLPIDNIVYDLTASWTYDSAHHVATGLAVTQRLHVLS